MNDQHPDEIEAYFEQSRRRVVRRLLFVCGFLAVVYFGYRSAPQGIEHISQLLALEDQGPSCDDPRTLFSASPWQGTVDYERFRRLFARRLPAYVDDLRKFRKHNYENPGADDGARLHAARRKLMALVANDPQASAILSTLTRLAEEAPEDHRKDISQRLMGLSVLMEERSLPFRLGGGVIQDEGMAILTIRVHELLAEETFDKGPAHYTVAFLDRVDLTNLERDPDLPPVSPETPDVLVRAVMTEANGTLLGALNPDGFWRLSPVMPERVVLDSLERDLARTVFTQWKAALELQVGSESWSALEQVSRLVARRNRFYRKINQREVGRLVMLEPFSVRLGWAGKRWLDDREPYAVQGLIRMRLEDIGQIRAWDRELSKPMAAAAPAIRAILLAQLKLAAIDRVERVHLRENPQLLRGSTLPEPRALSLAGGLAQVIEEPSQCASSLAMLAARALYSPTGDQLSSHRILRTLSQDEDVDAPISATELTRVMAAVASLACDTVVARARAHYEVTFGPYEPIVTRGLIVGEGP